MEELLKQAASASDETVYEACLIKQDGRVFMTDKRGKKVTGPAWNSTPMLYSYFFFLHEDCYWGINGVKTDLLLGDKKPLHFVNLWLCQELGGQKWLGKVEQTGEQWDLVGNMKVDEYGYSDLDSCIVFKDGKWRRFMYCNGYTEIADYDIAVSLRSDIERMATSGASAEFINAALEASGNAGRVKVEVPDEKSACRTLAQHYFKVIKECCDPRTSLEMIAARQKVPLVLAHQIQMNLGTRIRFI